MDVATGRLHLAASGVRDKFVPIRKQDLLSVLIQKAEFADTAECELFRRFARAMRIICHHGYSEMLDRLHDDYYYFDPDVAGATTADQAKSDGAYSDLIRSLHKVLKDANFEELPREDVADEHRRRTMPVEVKVKGDDFREVRFYRRGRHVETFELNEWFGLRRRKAEIEVFDDVVLLVAMKSKAEIASRRELRILKRHKIVPGSVLLKCFRNIACGDLYALFPNARVVMSNFDKAFLGVPAIAGGIPILLKLYATVSVLLLVIGIYLGGSRSIAGPEMKTAVAALTGIVALGGFATRQWLKYERQSFKYQIELTDNIYYRNINNNAGIFDYLIGTAEDQEWKQALLAYHFIRKAEAAPTVAGVEAVIEAWLTAVFGIELDFEIADALKTLDRFGLVRREGERLFVPPLEQAMIRLQEVWNDFFKQNAPVE